MIWLTHRPVSLAKAITRRLGQSIAAHHNKLQFFGYEAANIVLIVHESRRQEAIFSGLTFETCAALALLIGSAFIWRFDVDTRPSALFYGGLCLTAGGLALVAAGYSITGFAVALASLETARGGLGTLRDHIERRSADGSAAASSTQVNIRLACAALGWYVTLVSRLTTRYQRLGEFINERPFLTGTIIKAPMRLEFVVKKALECDFVAVAVGLSWMILGDGGLAFNDAKLKTVLIAYSQPLGCEGTGSVAQDDGSKEGRLA